MPQPEFEARTFETLNWRLRSHGFHGWPEYDRIPSCYNLLKLLHWEKKQKNLKMRIRNVIGVCTVYDSRVGTLTMLCGRTVFREISWIRPDRKENSCIVLRKVFFVDAFGENMIVLHRQLFRDIPHDYTRPSVSALLTTYLNISIPSPRLSPTVDMSVTSLVNNWTVPESS